MKAKNTAHSRHPKMEAVSCRQDTRLRQAGNVPGVKLYAEPQLNCADSGPLGCAVSWKWRGKSLLFSPCHLALGQGDLSTLAERGRVGNADIPVALSATADLG